MNGVAIQTVLIRDEAANPTTYEFVESTTAAQDNRRRHRHLKEAAVEKSVRSYITYLRLQRPTVVYEFPMRDPSRLASVPLSPLSLDGALGRQIVEIAHVGGALATLVRSRHRQTIPFP